MKRDDYSVVSKLANKERIVEATVVSVNAVTRVATVSLTGLSYPIDIKLGNIDPDSVLDGRARLLIYISNDGRAYTLARISDVPTDSSKPSVTLGDIGGNSKWHILDALRNEVFSISSHGIELHNNCRITQKVEFPPGAWTSGGNAPTKTITGDYPGMAYAMSDSSLVSLSVPEGADLTENLTIKLKWYIDEAYATGNGEVQWECAYSAVPDDESEAVDSAGYTGDLDPGDQNIPATAKYMTTTTLGTLAGASLSAGDIIGLEFSRVLLDGGSNPIAKPVATLLVVEYTKNKLGS